LAAFFATALGMFAASAVSAITYAITGQVRFHWLALHLAVLGGVSQLILGAGQFFVCAFLATSPPSRRLVYGQLMVWNVGTVLVAAGVTTTTTDAVDSGAVLLAAGLMLFAGSLHAMQRRSLQRARWAVRWYLASSACLGAGVLLGVLLARRTAWSHGSLLGAHLALNVAGWIGTAIVGTLHTFIPSLTATKLRFPRLQGLTHGLWLGGVVALAFGAAFDADIAVLTAWLALTVAAGCLVVNVVGSIRGAPITLTLPARLIAVAQAFLLAGVIVALICTATDGPTAPFTGQARGPLTNLLLIGWVGMTVAGALLHLLAVLARIRDLRLAIPAPRPSGDLAFAAFAGAAVTARAVGHVDGFAGVLPAATVLVVAAFVLLAVRILALAARAARAGGRSRVAPVGGRDAGSSVPEAGR
jgi:nitrite reductase (NO-forming)